MLLVIIYTALSLPHSPGINLSDIECCVDVASLLKEAAGDVNNSADQACTRELMTSFRATSQALQTVLSLHIPTRQLFPLAEQFLDKPVHLHMHGSLIRLQHVSPSRNIIRSHLNKFLRARASSVYCTGCNIDEPAVLRFLCVHLALRTRWKPCPISSTLTVLLLIRQPFAIPDTIAAHLVHAAQLLPCHPHWHCHQWTPPISWAPVGVCLGAQHPNSVAAGDHGPVQQVLESE